MTCRKLLKTSLCVAGLLSGLAVRAFAVDIKANVMMRGDMMRFEKEKSTGDTQYRWLLNNPVNQKDNPGDGLILEVDAGIAGARLAMWYRSATNNGADANEDDDWTAHFRRTYVWFKPIDMLKLQIGYVGCDQHFKEKIDEWKVGNPFSLASRDWVVRPGYINCNDVEGWGFGLEVRPIEPLIINAGITPGWKGSVEGTTKKDEAGIYKKTGEDTIIAPWGIGARYFWNDFEFQASFRNGVSGDSAARNKWRVARLGVGYKNERTSSFFQPILGFDHDSAKDEWKLNGMCLDMYSELYFDALTCIIHAPLSLRWSGDEGDRSYIEPTVKVKYNTGSFGNLDDVSPYIMLGANRDDALYNPAYRAWHLDGKHFADSFNLSYVLGVNFKVAIAEVDIGVKYDMLSTYAKDQYNKDWVFSIPFMVKIKNF